MKKILLLIALSVMLPTVSVVRAQTDDNSMQVANLDVAQRGGVATVSFLLNLGERVTPDNRSLIVAPVLRGQGREASLPPVVIRGKKAKAANETRAMAAAGIEAGSALLAANGQAFEYTASFPYEGWMSGSELLLNGINAGSGKATRVAIGMVADNLLAGAPTGGMLVDETIPSVSQGGTVVQRQVAQPAATQQRPVTAAAPSHNLSTGEKLAARFPFVEPVAEFNNARQGTADVLFDYNMELILGDGVAPKRNEAERFIDMTREGALSIRFQKGSSAVSRDLGENNRMLVDLISSIRALDAAPDARISHVIVVGFSAPEMPENTLDENDRLALQRAEAARAFLTANSAVRKELISVYNGSMDWSGLRKLVEKSDMPEKYRILDIIDNTPVWDAARTRGRMGELMAINGGEPYRYMLENFFPQLRQTGAYVKVYYENVR